MSDVSHVDESSQRMAPAFIASQSSIFYSCYRGDRQHILIIVRVYDATTQVQRSFALLIGFQKYKLVPAPLASPRGGGKWGQLPPPQLSPDRVLRLSQIRWEFFWGRGICINSRRKEFTRFIRSRSVVTSDAYSRPYYTRLTRGEVASSNEVVSQPGANQRAAMGCWGSR